MSARHLRTSRPSMASRLTRLSLLTPTTREVGARKVRWSLLLLPVLIVGLVFGIREVSRIERVLAAEGSRAARAIVYEIKPGGSLEVPIEPGTDVFRLVVHAMRSKASGPFSPESHVAHLVLSAQGAQATRTDDISIEIPGTTARVNPEDSSLVVSDPEAVNVDVHGVGPGKLVIKLDAIEGADAAVVRVYRRDALERPEVLRRNDRIDEAASQRLARRLGEVDWFELDEPEQQALLSARWRKVAALPDSKGLVTHAIAIAPAPPRALAHETETSHTSADLVGDERLAFIASGPTTLKVRADGDPDATIVGLLRQDDATDTTVDGRGELTIEIAAGRTVGVELTRGTPGILAVRATDPTKLEPSTHAIAWRTRPDHPAIVTAGASAILLRVTARRPVPRNLGEESTITLDATIATPGGTPETALLRAQRPRSIYDRYDAKAPMEAPTTSAVFHLLVPAGATATLTPEGSALDLAFSELDPSADPRPVLSYPADGPGPKTTKVGDVDWGGYVPRRPSNVATFDTSSRVLLRIPHRLVVRPEPATKAPSFRVKRPDVSNTMVINKKIFDPSTVSFEIEVPGGEALVLPVRIFTNEPMDVIARVDGAVPDRRLSGVAERITTPRKIASKDEVRSIVVLGDDLPAGTHILTFTPPPGKVAWVHLPWEPKPRPPGSPPPDPHWIEGDLED
jgi:hypothetical protein